MRCWLPAVLITVMPLVIAPFSEALAAEVHVRTREELVQAVRQARPGTTILIAPGTYQGGIASRTLHGTKEQPIVISGADPKNPPIIKGGDSGFQFSSPKWLEIRDLVITASGGNGLNIDDSGESDKPASEITLKRVTVRDVGPKGNRDGIKLSGVNDFLIQDCTIQRWGSSGSAIDMVGCHRGIVKGCQFAESNGDFANGVQTKGGSSEILISRCRFDNAGGRAVNVGGSTGLAYFRPSTADFEAKNITVEDCEIIGGMSAIAFVGVDGAVVQHNAIYRSRRWPVRILQENQDARFVACRNGRFQNNIIAFRSDEVREVINIGGKTEPASFQFAGNAWYCIDRPTDTRRIVRLPASEKDGTYGTDPGFANADKGDLRIMNRKADAAGVRSE